MVYCKVKGSYFLHLITAIKGDQFQISNNHGHVNGWIGSNSIFGICIAVDGKEVVPIKQLFSRMVDNIGELPSTVLVSSGPVKDE